AGAEKLLQADAVERAAQKQGGPLRRWKDGGDLFGGGPVCLDDVQFGVVDAGVVSGPIAEPGGEEECPDQTRCGEGEEQAAPAERRDQQAGKVGRQGAANEHGTVKQSGGRTALSVRQPGGDNERGTGK